MDFIDTLNRFLRTSVLSKHVSIIGNISDTYDYHPDARSSLLGKGGYGEVYRMKRKSDGNIFAVKCLDKARVCYSQDSLQHMMVEIVVLTTLGTHAGLTRCEAVHHNDKSLYIVMECVEGKYLSDEPLHRLYRHHLRHDKTPERSGLAMVEKALGDFQRRALRQVYPVRAVTEPDEVLQQDLLNAAPEVQQMYNTTLGRIVNEHLCIKPNKEPDLFTYVGTYKLVPKEKVIVIFKSLMETLHFLHTRQVVHRDIKLENVMVAEHRHMTTTKRPSDGRKVV
eukprot:PhF_6_TR32718/c0_g2_i1/m.48283